MKQNLIKKDRNSRKATNFVGSGIAIGAAIGMIFGLLFFGDQAIGCVICTAMGLVIGAAIDVQGSHETDPDA